MFWPFKSISDVSINEEKSHVSVTYLLGVAIIIFAIGYALKPVSEIIDELHDSDDSSDSHDERNKR